MGMAVRTFKERWTEEENALLCMCVIIPLAQGPRFNATKHMISTHASFTFICLSGVFFPRAEGCHGADHE